MAGLSPNDGPKRLVVVHTLNLRESLKCSSHQLTKSLKDGLRHFGVVNSQQLKCRLKKFGGFSQARNVAPRCLKS